MIITITWNIDETYGFLGLFPKDIISYVCGKPQKIAILMIKQI